VAPVISHAGEVLSRAVTFQFALDPNAEQMILFAKCSGARRFTVNHHLARVRANLDARSAELAALSEIEELPEPPTPSLSWTVMRDLGRNRGLRQITVGEVGR
jgi:hypothetical protein